jgi:BMFP domain-containing protein YqiC
LQLAVVAVPARVQTLLGLVAQEVPSPAATVEAPAGRDLDVALAVMPVVCRMEVDVVAPVYLTGTRASLELLLGAEVVVDRRVKADITGAATELMALLKFLPALLASMVLGHSKLTAIWSQMAVVGHW